MSSQNETSVNVSNNDCSITDLVTNVILLGVMGIFGVPANSLSQVVFWKKINSNSTSYLLFTLAIFDNVAVITHFWLRGVPVICTYFEIGTEYLKKYSPIFLVYGWPIAHLSQMCSMWNVVMVSFCRYIALCRPHSTQKYTSVKRMKVAVVTMVILNAIVYSPRSFIRYTQRKGDENIVHFRAYYYTTGYMIYNLPFYYIVMFVIPSVLLLVMSYYQIKTLKKSQKKRKQMTRSKREDRDVTVTLLVIVGVFMVCNIWEPIRRFAEFLPGSQNDCKTVKYAIYITKVVFTVFNSSTNIIIYAACGTQFRRELARLILRKNTVTPTSATTTVFNTAYEAQLAQDTEA